MTAAEAVMGKSLPFDYERLAECIADGRKDEVVIDFARLLSAHYGRMVKHFSSGSVDPHNNKTLFLEAADIWCRRVLAPVRDRAAMGQSRGRTVTDPKEIIEHYLTPWYEALKLEDPSRYRMRDMGPAPVYAGTEDDATCLMLSICASVDVTPIRFKVGKNGGKVARTWGKVHADGNWYDSDVNDPLLVLGEHHEFEDYDEVEVPL